MYRNDIPSRKKIEKELYRLVCDDYIEYNDSIWFAAFGDNGLYKVNKKNGEASLIMTFDEERPMRERLYKAVARVGKQMILAPCFSKTIRIVDLESFDSIKIPIKLEEKERCYDTDKLWDIVVYGKIVYMTGLQYPWIIRLQLTDYKIDYIKIPIDHLKIDVCLHQEYGLLAEGIVEKDTAYFPFRCADAMLSLDLKTGETKQILLETGASGYNGITPVGQDFWLVTTRMEYFIKWNPKNGFERYPILDGKSSKIPFYTPILLRDKLYVLPIFANHGYVIDIANGNIEIWQELEYVYKLRRSCYSTCWDIVECPKKLDKHRLLYISGADHMWHIYDCDTGKTTDFEILASEKGSKGQAWRRENQFNFSECETKEHGLKQFLFEQLEKGEFP